MLNSKTLSVGAMLIGLLYANITQAQDSNTQNGYFLGASAGATLFEALNHLRLPIFSAGNTSDTNMGNASGFRLNHGIGYNVQGSVGYRYKNIKLQTQFGYQVADVSKRRHTIDDAVLDIPLRGRVSGLSAMLVGDYIFEFGHQRRWGVEFGGGIGLAHLKGDEVTDEDDLNNKFLTQSDTGFAWQTEFGVFHRLTDHLNFIAEV